MIFSRLRIAAPAELYAAGDDLFDRVRTHMDESKVDCVFVDKAQFRTADGRVLTDGAQVSIEKSVYISLCRRHCEEETGRWPAKGPLP